MSATPARRAALLVPGLFNQPPASGEDDSPPVRLPSALSRLLARADREPGGPQGFEARLFALFGIHPPEGADLPVAPVTRFVDMGVVDREWWVRADPVYLEPRRDSLVLHAGLDLSRDEAERLAAELSEALAADGWLLKAPSPGRWYLKPPAAARIRTTPLAEAVGRDVHPLLPAGPDGRAWHTRLNELQILLHTSAVNAAREARGRLPANSVWFWGGGRLPQPQSRGWAQVWSREPLATGLARLAGIPAKELPENGRAWLELPQAPGDGLLVLDALVPAMLAGDAPGWWQALERLAADWLEPLAAAANAGTLAELTLRSDTGPAFRYRRTHRLRFWRRAPVLSEVA